MDAWEASTAGTSIVTALLEAMEVTVDLESTSVVDPAFEKTIGSWKKEEAANYVNRVLFRKVN